VITYTLKHTAEKPTKLSWTMVRGEMMKGNDGTWTLKPGRSRGHGRHVHHRPELSSLVPGFIEKALAEQSLPGLLANFKARAEEAGEREGLTTHDGRRSSASPGARTVASDRRRLG